MSPIRNEQNSTFLDRSSLVGEWLLDGNANDTSGNGNNGTATNVTWVGAERGYVSEVGSFNGSSSKVNISANLYPGTEFETSVFQKFNALPSLGTVMYFYSHRVDFGNGNAAYLINDGGVYRIDYTNYFTSGNVILSYNFTPTVGEYYLFSFCSTSNGMKIYINNVEVASNSNTGTLRASSNDLGIGAYSTGGGWLNGEIGLFRIYNTNQNTTQRKALYLEGLRRFGPFNAQQYPELFEGAVGYWDMNLGGAVDITGNLGGTNVGTTSTADHNGKTNHARRSAFNTNQYISHTATPSGTKTVYVISKKTATGQAGRIAGKSGGGEYLFQLWNDGKNYSNIGTGTMSFTQADDTNWHSYSIVANGTNARFYLDGAFVSQTASAGDLSGMNQIHKYTSTANSVNIWNGDTAVLIYFNRVLSDAEISMLDALFQEKYIYQFPRYSLPNLNEGKVLHIDGTNNGTTYYDQSGNGNHGTQSGGVTTSQLGLNKRIILDGSNDYIKLPQSVLTNIITNDKFHFSFKINYTTVSRYFLSGGTGGTHLGIAIGIDILSDGKIRGFIGYSGTAPQCISTTALTAGDYYDIDFTYDGTNLRMYINGVLETTTSAPSPTWGTADDFYIGRQGTTYFNGSTIDFKQYNVLQSVEEIQQDKYSNFISN